MSATTGERLYEMVRGLGLARTACAWPLLDQDAQTDWGVIADAVGLAGDGDRRAEDDAAWSEVGDRLARIEQRVQEHDERLDRLERWRAGEIRRAIDGGDSLRRTG